MEPPRGGSMQDNSKILLFDVEQFDLEVQCGVRRDRPNSALTIAKIRRNDQFTLAADLHTGNTFIPTFDDAARAQRKRKRLTPVH